MNSCLGAFVISLQAWDAAEVGNTSTLKLKALVPFEMEVGGSERRVEKAFISSIVMTN